ncbi:MAG: RNA polymerase sigma factor [Acidimicrobiales bacterium]
MYHRVDPEPLGADDLADAGEPERAPTADPPSATFEAFYRAQYADVYSFVLRRLTGSGDEVADVTAEVFATAWRRSEQMPPPPDDRLWIFGVARWVVRRQQRGHWRRLRLARRLDEMPKLARADDRGAGDVVDDEQVRADEGRRVRRVIGRLRAGDQELLALVLWDGLSHAEAARVLGCSENAVGVRLHRIRQRLRMLLEEDEEER